MTTPWQPYRKLSVVVHAFQWHGEEVVGFERIGVGLDELQQPRYNLVIETLEGTVYAAEGDYIIRGVADEVYPCRADIFHATYEPATTRPQAAEGDGDG